MRFARALALYLVLLAASCASGPKRLLVEDSWARPASQGSNSAVYFRIVNPGPSDILHTAETGISTNVSIHLSSQDENGVVRMMPQESVEIPAGADVTFQPGGLHLMLTDLKRPLHPGDEIEITLHFEIAGPRTLVAEARDQ